MCREGILHVFFVGVCHGWSLREGVLGFGGFEMVGLD